MLAQGECGSTDAKPTERSLKGKGDGAGQRDGGDFAMVVGMAVLGATGGASKASDKCSFAKISGNNKDWCNGRSELLPYEKRAG